jgi:hypothetical protein
MQEIKQENRKIIILNPLHSKKISLDQNSDKNLKEMQIKPIKLYKPTVKCKEFVNQKRTHFLFILPSTFS